MPADNRVVVVENDPDRFHERVLRFKSQGYVSRKETYRMVVDTDDDSGKTTYVHSIELWRKRRKAASH